jgi:hypothetical protein
VAQKIIKILSKAPEHFFATTNRYNILGNNILKSFFFTFNKISWSSSLRTGSFQYQFSDYILFFLWFQSPEKSTSVSKVKLSRFQVTIFIKKIWRRCLWLLKLTSIFIIIKLYVKQIRCLWRLPRWTKRIIFSSLFTKKELWCA